VLDLIFTLLDIYKWVIIAAALITWVSPDPRNPIVMILRRITEPVLAPFRRLLPPMGGIDFSPMLAFAAIYILQILLRSAAGYFGLPAQFAMGFLILGI